MLVQYETCVVCVFSVGISLCPKQEVTKDVCVADKYHLCVVRGKKGHRNIMTGEILLEIWRKIYAWGQILDYFTIWISAFNIKIKSTDINRTGGSFMNASINFLLRPYK